MAGAMPMKKLLMFLSGWVGLFPIPLEGVFHGLRVSPSSHVVKHEMSQESLVLKSLCFGLRVQGLP